MTEDRNENEKANVKDRPHSFTVNKVDSRKSGWAGSTPLGNVVSVRAVA